MLYVSKKNKGVLLDKITEMSDEEHNKPIMILEYNRGKRGIDTLDQLVHTYNCD